MLDRVPHVAGAAVLGVLLASTACSEPEAPQEIAPVAEEPPPADHRAAPVPDDLRAQLEALGYVSTRPTDDPELRGVTARAVRSGGYNVYCTRDRAYAVLTDMDGEVLHRWTAGDDEAEERRWMHVEPQPDGSLFVITSDRDLTKYDLDSRVLWRRRIRAHHDLAVREDGRVLLLVRRRAEQAFRGRELPILTDSIAMLAADGELLETIDLLPLLDGLVSRHRLARLSEALDAGEPARSLLRDGGLGDLLHANSIAILHRDIPGVAPAGSLLLSFRASSRVVILDARAREVLWKWGRGELQRQHDATQLDNGNLLIFDNGVARTQSRVIEVSPITGEIVWSYTNDELFSRIRGGAQALESGNVLITESEEGHALEVTRDGEMVWEFWNPDVRPGRRPRRAVIYRLNRFPESYFDPAIEW